MKQKGEWQVPVIGTGFLLISTQIFFNPLLAALLTVIWMLCIPVIIGISYIFNI